jgi:hypothetical protein
MGQVLNASTFSASSTPTIMRAGSKRCAASPNTNMSLASGQKYPSDWRSTCTATPQDQVFGKSGERVHNSHQPLRNRPRPILHF